MMKLVETSYEGRFISKTKSPLSNDPIKVDPKFGPIDLLMGAYGSCLLATVDFYAKKADFEVSASNSEISYGMHADGDRVGEIHVKIHFASGDYTSQQKELMENAAKKLCHVGNSLNPEIKRSYEFTYA